MKKQNSHAGLPRIASRYEQAIIDKFAAVHIPCEVKTDKDRSTPTEVAIICTAKCGAMTFAQTVAPLRVTPLAGIENAPKKIHITTALIFLPR